MRYAKQRTRRTCGPTAIVNLLKWIGYPVSHRELESELARWLLMREEGGATNFNMNSILKRLEVPYNFNSYWIKQPSLTMLKKYAKFDEFAIILDYWEKPKRNNPRAHYILMTEFGDDQFAVANEFQIGPALQTVDYKCYRETNRFRKRNAWFVYSPIV